MKKHNRFVNTLSSFFDVFNAVNPYYLVLAVISAHYLSFVPTGNEESYFPLAKQFVDPQWMPHSFVFNEWPGARFLFQCIAGFLLKYLSFEQLAFWGRLFVFIISAYPLTRLFKLFNFSNITLLLVLELFLVRHSWIGLEDIFSDFEPKSLAYIFVLFSLPLLVEGQYAKSIILGAVAGYFHILVGGWYVVFALCFMLVYERNFLLIFKLGALYVLISAPLIYYLSSSIISGGSVINGVNIDWVYVFYRNWHHTAPLSRPDGRTLVIGPAVFQMAACTLALFFLLKNKRGQLGDKLFVMNAVVFAMLWVGLIISFVNTSGSISKFYLFRISSVGALLYYIYVFWWCRRYYPRFAQTAGYILFFLFFIPSFAASTRYNVEQYLSAPDTKYIDLVQYIKTRTQPDDVFIEYKELPYNFMRMSERESFVVKKFDPGGGKKIYEWYMRMQELKKVRENINYLKEMKTKYKIDYLVSEEVLNSSEFEEKYSNGKYFVYKIK